MDPEDEYSLPVTPDGQSEKEDYIPQVNPHLSPDQHSTLMTVIDGYEDIFSVIPGCISTIEHDIILTTTRRVHSKLYTLFLYTLSLGSRKKLTVCFNKASSNALPLLTVPHWTALIGWLETIVN